MSDIYTTIVTTTEIRRSNGQCEYGDWLALDSEDVPTHIREAIADEVAEAMCRDMPREPHGDCTDEAGEVCVGGERWVYRRCYVE